MSASELDTLKAELLEAVARGIVNVIALAKAVHADRDVGHCAVGCDGSLPLKNLLG